MLALLFAPEHSTESERQAELGRKIDALVQAGEYDKALEMLEVADGLMPSADWLYMRGGILVLQGDCERAIEAYGVYFERGATSQAAAEAARTQIEACEESLGRRELEPTLPPPPQPQPQTEPPPPEPPQPEPRPAPPPLRARWRPDPWGTAALTVGTASLVGGLAFWLEAGQQRDRADASSSLGRYADNIERAETFSEVGLGLTVVGSAFVAGAIARFVVVRVRKRSDR